MTVPAPLAPARWSAAQEALALWFVAFGATAAVYVFSAPAAKLVATALFLYLPLWAMRRRGEDFRDYGLTLRRWREDLVLVATLCVIVLPLFFAAFAVFPHALELVPPGWRQVLSPYPPGSWQFVPRLPDRFWEWLIDQTFVVALPEELFYRGYLQARLRDAWPRGRTLLGARLGRAFWVTALLFAVGHLAIFQAWRLSVFFPALLFGWLRERTGTVAGATALHAIFNLFQLWLDASFVRG